MDEAMVERWNEIVKPNDRIYHLGDVVIPRRGLKKLENLNGRKILIKGNHDIFKLSDYTQYFDDIRGSHYLDGLILTHIPVHPVNLMRYRGNIHGHLHYRSVLREDETIDDRYQCVCVEHTDYAPIDFEEVRHRFEHLRKGGLNM